LHIEYEAAAFGDEQLVIRLWLTAPGCVSFLLERPEVEAGTSNRRPGVLCRAACSFDTDFSKL
jgi:hypothetical protein